jgi:hypothetical protein
MKLRRDFVGSTSIWKPKMQALSAVAVAFPNLRFGFGFAAFSKEGIEGLHSKSKRPTKTPEKKVTPQIEQ